VILVNANILIMRMSAHLLSTPVLATGSINN
jgi:hypothetical protein